ncbi:MAG: hypothetical protein J2P36_37250, partial [Ktedonobacteraceae bacterium]|nr:hypothetical protein [Ktedonobacteraceae bacterium]
MPDNPADSNLTPDAGQVNQTGSAPTTKNAKGNSTMSDNDTSSSSNSQQQQLTDLNNARGFLSLHGSHLKFVPGWGWLLWDG